MHEMAEFVADDGDELFIGHRVHKSGIHAHGTVSGSECIDLLGLVDLEVDRKVADGLHPAEQPVETLLVGSVVNHGLCIELGHGLLAELDDLYVGDARSSENLARSGRNGVRVPVDAGKDGTA